MEQVRDTRAEDEPGAVKRTCNPRTLEAEARESVVPGQPDLHSKGLSEKRRQNQTLQCKSS